MKFRKAFLLYPNEFLIYNNFLYSCTFEIPYFSGLSGKTGKFNEVHSLSGPFPHSSPFKLPWVWAMNYLVTLYRISNWDLLSQLWVLHEKRNCAPVKEFLVTISRAWKVRTTCLLLLLKCQHAIFQDSVSWTLSPF
jgi:hypothetical protein